MDIAAIGIIGAFLVLLSWVYETIEELKERKSLVDLKFAVVNLIGTSILTYYSYVTGLTIFVYLNIALVSFISFEIFYTIYLHKKGRFKKKTGQKKNVRKRRR